LGIPAEIVSDPVKDGIGQRGDVVPEINRQPGKG
jgi:hypothetical protein